jgi:hypothetical protein
VWCTAFELIAAVGLLAQAGGPWSMAVDPAVPGQTPHWTLELSAPYCGGFRIGEGVYLHAEPPLALPAAVPDGSVLFQGEPASVDVSSELLRISPGPGAVFSQVCLQGERAFTVELLPAAGLGLPPDPGTYTIDVWLGASPTTLVTLSFEVPPAEP